MKAKAFFFWFQTLSRIPNVAWVGEKRLPFNYLCGFELGEDNTLKGVDFATCAEKNCVSKGEIIQ